MVYRQVWEFSWLCYGDLDNISVIFIKIVLSFKFNWKDNTLTEYMETKISSSVLLMFFKIYCCVCYPHFLKTVNWSNSTAQLHYYKSCKLNLPLWLTGNTTVPGSAQGVLCSLIPVNTWWKNSVDGKLSFKLQMNNFMYVIFYCNKYAVRYWLHTGWHWNWQG
jgi:hypothetical protein